MNLSTKNRVRYIAAALLLTQATYSWGITSAQLYSFCTSSNADTKHACTFFILGAVQGIRVGAASAHNGVYSCIPDDVKAPKLVAIYMAAHEVLVQANPKNGEAPAISMVGASIKNAYPCK